MLLVAVVVGGGGGGGDGGGGRDGGEVFPLSILYPPPPSISLFLSPPSILPFSASC